MAQSQILQPQRPYVTVQALGSMLYRWERYGLSDSSITKMLALWDGMQLRDLMDDCGRWPKAELSYVARRIGYHSFQSMIDDVRRSHGFYILGNDEGDITSLCSPVWYDVKKLGGKLLDGSSPIEDLGQNGAQNCPDNNSYNNNNNPTGSNAEALAIGMARRMVKDYFAWLLEQQDPQQAALVQRLLDMCMHPRDGRGHLIADQQIALEADGRALMQLLIETRLVPYLAERREFFKPVFTAHPEQRYFWLRNLFKPRFIRQQVIDARRIWLRRIQSAALQEKIQQQALVRQNRPLSPYEWTDDDGFRWYELDGVDRLIQQDAPPRPSALACWDYVNSCWK